MKTLVFGVWYNGVGCFWRDYIHSLKEQTDKDFDILIIVDGCSFPEDEILPRLTTIEANPGSTQADIRLQGIRYAQQHKYDIIIFSDCDDYFSSRRVEYSKLKLPYADVYVNNLTLVSSSKKVLKENVLTNSIAALTFNDLLKSNIYGLSNTAVKLTAFNPGFYIPSEIIAIDWWIFSLLMLNNAKFLFDNDATTFYRQHSNNTIGMGTILSREKLYSGIRVKIIHYRSLLEYLENNKIPGLSKEVEKQLSGLEELCEMLNNSDFEKKYIYSINKNYPAVNHSWWGEILTINDWKEYV